MNKEEALKALSEGKKIRSVAYWIKGKSLMLHEGFTLIDEQGQVYSFDEFNQFWGLHKVWEIVDENKSHSIKGDSRV